MSFFERYELLCKERGLRPQSKEIMQIVEVTSPAITGWSKGTLPKADVLIKLSKYFEVSTDYLLCLTELRVVNTGISEDSLNIAKRFDALDADGQALVRVELIKAESRKQSYENMRKVYIEKNATPYAAAHGDTSGIDELQKRFDDDGDTNK